MALVELPAQRPILIAEDNEDARSGLAEFLRGRGFKVVEASNGDDAVKLVRTLGPSLLLLDLMMPGLNGYDVLKVLGRSGLLDTLPVVVTSDFDDHVPPGALAVLQKPLRLDLLLRYAYAYARAALMPVPLLDVVATAP